MIAILLRDVLKIQIREILIKYAKQQKAKQKRTEMTLETEILMLEQKLENNLSEVEKCGIRTKLEIKKQSPEQWINYKTQGSIVRSRTSWYHKVEKNTKYFFEWKKGHFNCKTTRIDAKTILFIIESKDLKTIDLAVIV